MENKLPRFFKVLMPGFRTRLAHNKIRRCKEGNNRLCFKNGWKEFVKQNRLVAGDFVVFKHTSRLIFKVNMFDLTCCEKDCHGQSETYNNIIDGEGCAQGSNGDGVQLHKHEKVTTDKNRKRVTKGVNISPREQCPQFTKTITP
ncbi:unnamed protein product, partial [Cuscuta epithymum]